MSLLLASAAVTAAAMVPACSWNTPGRNPYRGTATEAVSRYVDIPAATRARLVARIDAGTADDDVVITRDAVLGRSAYGAGITDMHFGRQTVCERVTRERWPASAREPAKVYCADGYCLIVPRVCGNISRIRKAESSGGNGPGEEGGGGPAANMPAFPHRPGWIPEPAGAPEIDIETTDAMARLAAAAPTPAPPSLPIRPFDDWTPGPGGPFRGPSNPPVPVASVPEPAGWLMFLVGATSLLFYSRFRK
ncbi:MAG TPA: MHFG family PEP-CTERM protein [Pseudoduganella sp.]|jgi:hypothetical protein